MAVATRSERLERLRKLRRTKAPTWIIKSEQVMAVLNRMGLHSRGLGRRCNAMQSVLMARHVAPLMGKD